MLAYRCEEDRSSATDLLFHQVPLPSYKQTPLDDLASDRLGAKVRFEQAECKSRIQALQVRPAILDIVLPELELVCC